MKTEMTVFVILLSAIGVIVGVGCEKGTPPDDNPLNVSLDPAQTGMASIWMHYPAGGYSIKGDSLQIEVQAFHDTVRQCTDSGSSIDTLRMPSLHCTVPFSLTADTLKMLLWTEAPAGTAYPAIYRDTAAVVQWNMLMLREGSGTDLVGTWLYEKLAWDLKEGELTTAERAELNGLANLPDSLFGKGILPAVEI
ncbi:MAG: hypothetical protein GF344_19705, partial [Chitinivibrionales bacterium]|nr:hypothetical protein [Chitinivibrionales bacterium]